jgi:hypothetical protein
MAAVMYNHSIIRDNELSMAGLKNYPRQVLARKAKVTASIAAMETADAFGVDDLTGSAVYFI